MANTKSFAQRAMGGNGEAVREAVGKERQLTGRAAELELRSSDGRSHEALSWGHYRRRKWTHDGKEETLVLLFSDTSVLIGGSNLQRLTEMIREERLAIVQEQDSAEAALLEDENRNLVPAMRRAIVTDIRIEPDFEQAVSDLRQREGDQE